MINKTEMGSGKCNFIILFFFLFSLSFGVSAKNIQYKIQGINGDLKNNVVYYLDSLSAIPISKAPLRESKIKQAVRQGMQALGYYSPKITFSYPKADDDQLVIQIDKGDPVHVRNFYIELNGDAKKDPDFQKILATPDLKEKSVFNHAKYENLKSRIKTLAVSNGYFDARMTESSVKIYPSEKAADVVIDFESGHRYKFGEIHVEGIPDTSVIDPLLHFKTGEAYSTRQLAQLSQSLSQTKYFQTVNVHPDTENIQNYTVPVLVKLTHRKDNIMETGVGYSTDEGPRLQWNWEKPWVNDKGHHFTSQLKIAQTTQSADFSYYVPNKNPIDDYYKFQTTLEEEDLDDTQYKEVETGVHYITKLWGDWQRDYFLKTQYEEYTQGEDEGNTLLYLPGVSLTRVRSRGGMDPDWGDTQTMTVMFSDPAWMSDTRFVSVWGRSKWLRTYAEKHRLIFRAEQGALLWGNLDEIPASERFFTGGDQTIRGYSYQSISPKDSSGKLSGALNTSVVSLEYNYQFAPKWRIATFVDAGTATNDYQDAWKVGTGIGTRWLSPVGPLKIDLAFGVSERPIPFRIHFALGPDL